MTGSGKSTLIHILSHFFSVASPPKNSEFWNSYQFDEDYDLIIIDEFAGRVLKETGIDALNLLKQLAEYSEVGITIRHKYKGEFVLNKWRPVIIVAQHCPEKIFNSKVIPPADFDAFKERFVCVSLPSKM